MSRSRWRTGAVGALLMVAVACGGRFDQSALDANDAILAGFADLPGAEPVAVETYGYDVGNDDAEDDFFTEVEYEIVDATLAGDVIDAVAGRLDGWDHEIDGEGGAAVAMFKKGDARISVTTWDGGFDLTVAAEGGRLDGTRLSLAP